MPSERKSQLSSDKGPVWVTMLFNKVVYRGLNRVPSQGLRLIYIPISYIYIHIGFLIRLIISGLFLFSSICT